MLALANNYWRWVLVRAGKVSEIAVECIEGNSFFWSDWVIFLSYQLLESPIFLFTHRIHKPWVHSQFH